MDPGEREEKPGRARRLVVVDDDPILLEALAELFVDEGYEVEPYLDPKSALDRLRREPPPELALIDYVMPGMHGVELLETLRREGLDVPVLLLSALSAPELPEGIRVAGVLRKPFDLDRLLAQVDRLSRRAA